MLFSVSGIEVSPFVPPLAAFVVSLLGSMGGLSGAFLLLPFQLSVLGYNAPSVSATNQFFNVVGIPGGVYGYIKEKRMVWPLALTIAAGTLPGVFAGACIHMLWLDDPKPFKLFVAAVLFYIGIRMLRDLLATPGRAVKGGPDGKGEDAGQAARKDLAGGKYLVGGKEFAAQNSLPEQDGIPGQAGLPGQGTPGRGMAHGDARADFTVREVSFNLKRISYTFQGRPCVCPTAGLFGLSLIAGVIGGIYGIGGGAIIAPFLLAVFKLPVYTTSGATLMGTLLTSIFGVLFYTLVARFFPAHSVSPDWLLGLFFGLGGIAGMYCGARLQRFVAERAIKWLLLAMIMGIAVKYAVEFLG